jgi:hypothetical protein
MFQGEENLFVIQLLHPFPYYFFLFLAHVRAVKKNVRLRPDLCL